ncbi:hypothetical protein BLOT_004509 [Blomia tropicalis]|nr:hypothetical protein BLOT_004509 [Blomia tropicalis]
MDSCVEIEVFLGQLTIGHNEKCVLNKESTIFSQVELWFRPLLDNESILLHSTPYYCQTMSEPRDKI